MTFIGKHFARISFKLHSWHANQNLLQWFHQQRVIWNKSQWKEYKLKRCHSCNGTALTHTRYCLYCYIKDCVRKTLLITETQAKQEFASLLLKKLENQNHRCVYTNRLLVPGVNMSLDHILPKSLYPEGFRELSNLVWVDKSCNIAKNNLLPVDFLSLCEDVVLYRSHILQATLQADCKVI